MKKENQFSLVSQGLRHKIGIAIALMSTIPLLIVGYIVLFYLGAIMPARASVLLLIAIVCSILGIYLIGEITSSILRLHRLARTMVNGDRFTKIGKDELKQLNEVLKIMGGRLEILDKATGLHSRTFFETAFHQELEKSISSQRPCGLVLLQIIDYDDYLRKYDRDIVNSLLIDFGQILIGNLEEEDRLIRYEPDKLAIILPGKTTTQIKSFIEIIKKRIKSYTFDYAKETIKEARVKFAFVVCPADGTGSEQLSQKVMERLR
ncbi:MAG: diguanylate cyclase [Candidatus Omnitrophica bacterium]|nr:diguanylate cyclase [Candidatus Omnitrophota bacterium]